jgi:hypothetical protein
MNKYDSSYDAIGIGGPNRSMISDMLKAGVPAEEAIDPEPEYGRAGGYSEIEGGADAVGWPDKYSTSLICRYPSPGVVERVAQSCGFYRNKTYNWVCDGDMWTMLVRTDMLYDQGIKDRFREKHGRDWHYQNLWDWEEFNRVVKHMDEQNIVTGGNETRGAWLWRNRLWSYCSWGQRYFSKVTPNCAWLDDNLDLPWADAPEAVAALKQQGEINENMDDITRTAPSFTNQYVDMPAGKAFASTCWPSLSKYCKDPGFSSVVDMIEEIRVPANILPNGEQVSLTGYYGGVIVFTNNYSGINLSPTTGPVQREASYLYQQFISGPTNGTIVVSKPGYFDPYRRSHMFHPRVDEMYHRDDSGTGFRMMQDTDLSQPPLNIKGAFEVSDKMNIEYNRYHTGEGSAEDAVSNSAREWRDIIERLKAEGFENALKEQWQTWKSVAVPIYTEKMGFA